MRWYIDGSGWNMKESKACVVSEDGKKLKIKLKEAKTSNEMEYEALMQALSIASKDDIILTDSQLVVGQVIKNWRVNKCHLKHYVREAKKLVRDIGVTLIWIPREENLAGQVLEHEN